MPEKSLMDARMPGVLVETLHTSSDLYLPPDASSW